MAKDMFKLPTDEVIERVYGARHPGNGTTYLHNVRTGGVKPGSNTEVVYLAMCRMYATRLADEVLREFPSVDAVVMPPSSRSDAAPYMAAIMRGRNIRDLTPNFSRLGHTKAGVAANLQDVIDDYRYTPDGSEASIRSLLIVDESTASGKTAATVLHHLRLAGLTKDCKIAIAVWARLKD